MYHGLRLDSDPSILTQKVLGTKGLCHLCAIFAEHSFSQFSLYGQVVPDQPVCYNERTGMEGGQWMWHTLTLARHLWQSHSVFLQSNSWAVDWISAQWSGRKIGWTSLGLKEQWLTVKKPTFNTTGENFVQWLLKTWRMRERTPSTYLQVIQNWEEQMICFRAGLLFGGTWTGVRNRLTATSWSSATCKILHLGANNPMQCYRLGPGWRESSLTEKYLNVLMKRKLNRNH